MRIRIAFLVRRLDRGGAEHQLLQLACGLDRRQFDVTILAFYAGGKLESAIPPESGVRLVVLGKRSAYDVTFLWRLVRTLRSLQPHIVHGYMTGANELSILGRLVGARVVWGLRATDLRLVPQSLSDRVIFRLGTILAHRADRLIANSISVRDFHVSSGYPAARTIVIPNGIDTARFSISPVARARVRREWGVAEDELLVGRAARFHPMKDYPTFLEAAALVRRARPDARFACVGDETDDPALRDSAGRLGIADRMIWAGGRSDMPAVYNAFDVSVSSSVAGEGFPNAVAESMACGTPCVVTDVGDSAALVGEHGMIVPRSDPVALADGILRVAAEKDRHGREAVRRLIAERFDVPRLVARSAAEFEKLLAATSRPSGLEAIGLAGSGPGEKIGR